MVLVRKNPKAVIDLTGQKFGKLTVEKRAANSPNGSACWWVHCDCGNKTVACGVQMRNGATVSCGCVRKALWTKQIKKEANMTKFLISDSRNRSPWNKKF